jgi:hypothetical protein
LRAKRVNGTATGQVGSWGDTLSDDQVLASLQRWNRGEPPLDYVIASTGGRE